MRGVDSSNDSITNQPRRLRPHDKCSVGFISPSNFVQLFNNYPTCFQSLLGHVMLETSPHQKVIQRPSLGRRRQFSASHHASDKRDATFNRSERVAAFKKYSSTLQIWPRLAPHPQFPRTTAIGYQNVVHSMARWHERSCCIPRLRPPFRSSNTS